MDAGSAGTASSLFPLFGAFSVVVCGLVSDRIGRTGRAAIILLGLVCAIPALLALGYCRFSSPGLAIAAIGAVAFCVLGPYAFLAGAIALDFGGKRGSATASGWIDGTGYIAGILAGEGIGGIAQRSGWSSAFLALSGVAALSCIAAVALLWLETRARRI